MAGFTGRTADINVKPSTTGHILQHCHDEFTYSVTSPRGRLLLINNQDFDTPVHSEQKRLSSRKGSEIDCDNLEELFKQLDFIVNVHENVSSKFMMELLEKETRLEEQKQYGMFTLIILSHGDKSCIYGKDGRAIYYNDIYKQLSARSFRAMAGKPKLLLFQACSGSSSEKSPVTADSCEVEDEAAAISGSFKTRPQSAQISANSDLLIIRSSFPGYVSLLDSYKGSFLMKAFIEVVQQYAGQDELEILSKKVRSTVYKICEEDKEAFAKYGHQTIHSSSTLTKSLYFFPGYDPTKPLQPVTEPVLTAITKHAAKSATHVNYNKLTHVEDIKTPDWCLAVCHLPDGRVVHGLQSKGVHGLGEKPKTDGFIKCAYLDESTGKLFVLSQKKPSDWLIYAINPNTSLSHCVIKYPMLSSRIQHLAVNKDFIVTTDESTAAIKVFRKGGEYQHLYDIKIGSDNVPWGINFLNEDSVVITDSNNHLVLNVRLSEKLDIIWSLNASDGIKDPIGVHINRQSETIFVNDVSGTVIYIISSTGELLNTLKIPGCEKYVYHLSMRDNELLLANGEHGLKKYKVDSN